MNTQGLQTEVVPSQSKAVQGPCVGRPKQGCQTCTQFQKLDFHAVAEQGQRAVSPGSGLVMRGPLPGEIPLGERGGTGVGHNEINPW